MTDFIFQWPWVLLGLAGLVPLSVLLKQARTKRWQLAQALGARIDTPRHLKDRMRLLALGLGILALARPGIDPQRFSVENLGRDIVFVLDVSQSMLAQDVAPSRLEVAKQGIRDALEQRHADRVGLLIYAGSANILCPLTQDYDFVRYMLEQASPRSVDFGGTQLISAIEKTVDQVLDKDRGGLHDIVLLTDGEDHGRDFQRIADTLTQADVGLLIIGVGDAERGARIPQELEDGRRGWLTYEGQTVQTKLDRSALTQLASAYRDASYIEAGTRAFDLGLLYRDFAKTRPKATNQAVGDTIVVYREVGLLFVLLGLIVFLLAEFGGLWQRTNA